MSTSADAVRDWELVSSDDALARLLAEIGDRGELAVDTEFMRRNTYYPQVALLQLCAGDRAFLVDPLAVQDVQPLRALLTDTRVVKLLHSCSEDLEVFRRWLGILPAPLIDTQRALAMLGEGFGVGYRTMVERFLGLELEKGETRSDWLRRPLTDSQCHYAAQDVLQLWRVWPLLRERIVAADRMDWLVEEGEEMARALAQREAEAYRRMRGAGKLRPRQLAVLRLLWDWRETRARALDRPRGWVLDDKACLALCERMPRTVEELAALDILPPSVVRKQSAQLLACVERGCSLPEAELPEALPGGLTPAQRTVLKTLRTTSKNIAEASGIAPEMLVSGADLELLLRQAEGQRITEPTRWQGWRKALVIEPLRQALG